MKTQQVLQSELLSLFNMSQQLGAFQRFSLDTWRRHIAYLREGQPGSLIPYQHFQFVNFPDFGSLKPNTPVIFTTMHFGKRFVDGMSETTRRLVEQGFEGAHMAIVGGHSDDSRYRNYYAPLREPDVRHSYPLKTIGVKDVSFSRSVVKHLKAGGVLHVALDANGGVSREVHGSFLRSGLSVKGGILNAAVKLGAAVVPMITDHEAKVIYFGEMVDASQLKASEVLESSLSFFAAHILTRPEMWLHWEFQHLMAMRPVVSIIEAEPDDSELKWVFSTDGPTPLALELYRWRLFELDQQSIEAMKNGLSERALL